jgi:hypothetical protein
MNPMGSGLPGQPGNTPGPAQSIQYNSSSGPLYASQSGNININNGPAAQRGPRTDTKVILVAMLADVAFFFYGMLAYTGHNTSSDDWRAGIFLFMFFATSVVIGRWIRRRI